MRHTRKAQFRILKANGRAEPFSKKKLLLSLEKTGLPPKECHTISNLVAAEVDEGSPTKDIYNKALKLIKKTSPLATVHYSLKRSLFDLGPEGHHFETFVGKYFEEIGYVTDNRKVLQGKFVKHEVDVVASLKGKRYFSECKFHNHSGVKNDVKISLYVKARWDDLKDGPEGADLHGFYVASNTSFTKDAITYSKGTGLELLGVNMPEGETFFDQIKKLKLYPITSLRRLPRLFRRQLLQKNVVLAKEVKGQTTFLRAQGMSMEDINILLEEIEFLTTDN